MTLLLRASVCVSLVAGLGVCLGCSSSGPATVSDASTSQPSQGDAEDEPTADASADTTGARAGLWWASEPATDVAGAATNDTLAIAYVEASSGPGVTPEGRLMLQLLDGQLNPRGGLREIDRQPIADGTPPIASVATDGTSFLVCWSPTDQIRCLAPEDNGGASLLFQTGGVSPTLVFQSETWALAYVTSPRRTQMNEARVARFSREGAPLAASTTFPYDAYFGRPVSFVATPSGFALLAGRNALTFYRLTAELVVQGTPVDTGLAPWGFHTLAATDDEAAMGLAMPYGNVLLHVRGSEVALRQERGCASKAGCDAAVALQGNTFAVAWWSTNGELSFFADIDHAGTAQAELAGVASSIALVPFGSHVVVVGKGVP